MYNQETNTTGSAYKRSYMIQDAHVLVQHSIIITLSINKIMPADKGAICHSRRSKAYSFQASGSIKV